ncbi:hypothetical protein EST38_g14180 [Candolleomyces aberdarensis]|uniref:Uncharacterized protein n=1 Tax=Candolleomyces aberdarensis TaxID=2316362 RepID=A0A4Q2D0N2_9AGAR|nr:hypothetical protein EST38_g14180 [Candolleomyces aberdarensis]
MATPPPAEVTSYEAIVLQETRFKVTFAPETSVKTASDNVAQSLDARLASLSGERIIAPRNWRVDYIPRVDDPANKLLSSFPAGKLHMVFSTSSNEPTVARAFGHTVARVTAYFNKSLPKIHETLLDVDLSQKRCLLLEELLTEEAEGSAKKKQELSEQTKLIHKQTKLIQDQMVVIQEQMTLLTNKDAQLDEQLEALKKLAIMTFPLLLRILMDDTRAEIARTLGKEDWYDLKDAFKGSMPSVYERIKDKLSPKAWELVSHGNRYRDAGNASAHNAPPALIIQAVESLPFGTNREAFEAMIAFAYNTVEPQASPRSPEKSTPPVSSASLS